MKKRICTKNAIDAACAKIHRGDYKKRPDLLLARVPVRNIDKLIGASENPLFVNDWRERNSSTTETRAHCRQTMYYRIETNEEEFLIVKW